MAIVMKKYPLGGSGFTRAATEGFTLLPDGALLTAGDGRHMVFFGSLDSNQRDCQWGRLRFEARLDGDAVAVVRAFATNEPVYETPLGLVSYDDMLLGEEPALNKLRLFEEMGCSRFVGAGDMLLYQQSGRWLMVCVEIIGEGEALLSDFTVYSPRDNFLGTFPEIYRNNADFFHRYLSVFSSLYYDLQDTIDTLDQYVDVDTTPREALPILAGWLGLELDGDFLSEPLLRRLVKASFGLIRRKGTLAALEELLRICVDEPFYIVERRVLPENVMGENRRSFERLYGRSPFGLVVLICRPADEHLHARLKYLIRQFIPARSSIKLVFLDEASALDAYCYLDINARVSGLCGGALDAGAGINSLTYLE